MTFCLGIRVREGLLALADTQIVKGSERLNKTKLHLVEHRACPILVMTSGLRSVRDKTVIYTQEKINESNEDFQKLYEVVNLFGDQLRRVRREDGEALAASGLDFNTHAIIGGQLGDDPEPQLFFVYPEGNWIEVNPDSPYFVVGRTYYGRPILDQLLDAESSLRDALALAFVAFELTRASVTDVGFPIDVVLMNGARHLTQRRFHEHELLSARDWWRSSLRNAARELPLDWASPLFTWPENHR